MSGDEPADVDASRPLRARLDAESARLAQQFLAGVDITHLVRSRCDAVDAVLRELWDSTFGAFACAPDNAALLAVGGYGRGELMPHSDIDLLIVLRDRDDACTCGAIESFVAGLWNLGLKVGHAVRTLAECRTAAAEDLTVFTTLLEVRALAGCPRLAARIEAMPRTEAIWPPERFHHAKLAEQRERHRQYDHVDYDLEPNVKSSPGGLRDLATVLWILRRRFDSGDLARFEAMGLLTDYERRVLEDGQRFLWRVRWGLHQLAGRADDRLLFGAQQALAASFGYVDSRAELAIEQFMHDYYRHVLAMRAVVDILLQVLDESFLAERQSGTVEALNGRFQIRDGSIETVAPDVFRRTPSALLELFVLLANHPEIHGVRAATIRQIREHLWLIDENFRNDRRNTRLFMELLGAPHRLVSQLTRMRRYGVLGQYLPEFGRVVGQMQYDLFHIYTVDAHTLQVIRNMRRFQHDSVNPRFQHVRECVQRLARIELLYIAGLFHDIAKGRGGDHSELGEYETAAFCARHGIDRDGTDLVCWLVRNHLAMSSTAQRRDLSDPDVISEFAQQVGNRQRLDYLYALTVADITATNPTLWNSWRASLLRQLYGETAHALEQGIDNLPERGELLEDGFDQAMTGLAARGIARAEALRLLCEPGDDYYLRYPAADIVWQALAIRDHQPSTEPLVVVRNRGSADGSEGAAEIFVHTAYQPSLFAACCAVLDRQGLSVVDARIHRSGSGRCFNTFQVLDEQGHPPGLDASRAALIRDEMIRALADPSRVPEPRQRRLPMKVRHFVIGTEVTVSHSPGDRRTALHVVARDRPGLLVHLAILFAEEGLEVDGARITTLGARVEDTFFVRSTLGGDDDPAQFERVRVRIRERLEAEAQEVGT